MSVISLNLNHEELSVLLKNALINEIEDCFDYQAGLKGYEEYKKITKTYLIDEMIRELF